MEKKLTIIKFVGHRGRSIRYSEFECGYCSSKKVMRDSSLSDKKIKSCGCLKYKKYENCNTKKDTYPIWNGMIQRCYRESSASYIKYGAKGIRICNRWRESFENFLEDMGNRPTNRHTIDRIDNSKGYSLENCRWATYTEQNKNRSTTIKYKEETASDASRRLGGCVNLVHKRIHAGWSISEAFNKQLRKKTNKK